MSNDKIRNEFLNRRSYFGGSDSGIPSSSVHGGFVSDWTEGCSPSPRPSPLGRGGMVHRPFDHTRAGVCPHDHRLIPITRPLFPLPEPERCNGTDGERGRLHRSRRRPADGPGAVARTHQMVNGLYSSSCSAGRRTERPGRSRSPFPTVSFRLRERVRVRGKYSTENAKRSVSRGGPE